MLVSAVTVSLAMMLMNAQPVPTIAVLTPSVSTTPVASAASARMATSVMAATARMLTSVPKTQTTVMPMLLASTLTVVSHALATPVSLETVHLVPMSMSAQ
jgi:hypothetical protein